MMVATKLSEVAAKGRDWAYNSGGVGPDDSSPPQTNPPNRQDSMSDQALAYADHAYTKVSDLMNSVYDVGSNAVLTSLPSFGSLSSHSDLNEEGRVTFSSPLRNRALLRFGQHATSSSDALNWMFLNPANSVRGRHYNRSSLGAVRSLLTNIPQTPTLSDNNATEPEQSSAASLDKIEEHQQHAQEGDAAAAFLAESQDSSLFSNSLRLNPKSCETASQLAEGTVRALRDISLDDAVELHQALRFWSVRWENPMLSWLEAGPMVWFSAEGYNHNVIGKKVSQIQAILARRCSLIGELQHHLLRAGWQRGVAQWGCLGHGGQWAAIQTVHEKAAAAGGIAAPDSEGGSFASSGVDNTSTRSGGGGGTENNNNNTTSKSLHRSHSKIGESGAALDPRSVLPQSGYYTNVFVRNRDDGEVCMDDAALAEWSVDAMILIRKQLNRAANGQVVLPYEENWNKDDDDDSQQLFIPENTGELITPAAAQPSDRQLPSWAILTTTSEEEEEEPQIITRDEVVISDIRLMACEVSELLNVIEDIMDCDRFRVLEKVNPPSVFQRNWYVTAILSPPFVYLLYRIIKGGYGPTMIKNILHKIQNFFLERVADPVLAIIEEVWKGRERMSDRKARIEAIAVLKSMIRSWLDENCPDMPLAEKDTIAEAMDVSLIEKRKAESMKTFYEINSVVRMSFIEMQFLKKEMMNAMYAMDEMMSANDINMNLAAVTPALILSYYVQQSFKYFFYALLKLGKSREETFASFRHTLTDIERLLVMRNNPPTYTTTSNDNNQHPVALTMRTSADGYGNNATVLNSDDLGMLMLHIHECRSLLWNHRRRFSDFHIRSVSEDLAELAGERGAVSVAQQLQIVERMNRTYPFLKVVGVTSRFHFRYER